MLSFRQFLEAKKIYDIRLHPEDAAYGIASPERKKEIQDAGLTYSQFQIDAWNAAVDSTRDRILKSYSPEMREAEAEIRKNLPELRKDARCTRCSGRGYLDDNEKWIQYRGDPVNRVGFKGCFKCKGSGIEPKMEPVFFRRRVVDHIINKLEDGKINQVKQWASMVQNSTLENQPYKPLLMDIVELIDKLNDINILKSEIDKLPH